MTRKWMLIPLAMLIALIPALGCMEEGAPPDETAAKIAGLQAKADANAALITQLQSRVSTVEGRAAGEVTQAELNALAAQVAGLETTIADLEAQIAEWEEGGSPTTPIEVTETRWRPRVTFDFDKMVKTGVSPEEAVTTGIEMYTKEIDPRTIKVADVYTFVLGISNANEFAVTIEDLVITVLLQPTDEVFVSDDTDAYQISGPYNIFWNVDLRESASTGKCRFIEMETDVFDLKIDTGNPSSPKTTLIELEFELVYGE